MATVITSANNYIEPDGAGYDLNALLGGYGMGATGTSSSMGGSGTTLPYSVDQLAGMLQQPSYTPLTDEQIRQQAQNKYDPIYNADKMASEQSWEAQELAYDQKLRSLEPSYNRQREEAEQNYAQAYSNAQNQALSRGMQRSSFTNATLSNIEIASAKTQQLINEAQTLAETDIAEAKRLGQTQLAQTLERLATDYVRNLAAYEDDIRNQDYERAFQAMQYANQLAMFLAEYGTQQYQWQAQMAENARQFDLTYALQQQQLAAQLAAASKSSSSGDKKNTPPKEEKDDYDEFANDMGNTGKFNANSLEKVNYDDPFMSDGPI